ncbi:MAG: PucR family transcriptional regulator ligand-binding domain-containing protein [Actinobacteria bacterium]|nr:PucR family transcriptional regulator ligand-binding domain-containing protein [Actinomycetota bacterium]
MPLTVAELTQIPYLRTRLHAGGSGADNVISWAHSVEVHRPWEWLEAKDLLMTVGLGVPVDPDEQVEYVWKLAAVGVSGVAIGEEMQAPPLSDGMIAAADEAAMPLLITAYEVPFVQVSRAVAEANRADVNDRVVRAARVYDKVRSVIEGGFESELLGILEREVNCRLSVCAHPTAEVVLAGSSGLDGPTRTAIRQAIEGRPRQAPGLLRLEVEAGTCLLVPLPLRRSLSLVAIPGNGPAPPYSLLQHVATVAALQLERQWSQREELGRTGAELFAQMHEGRAPATRAAQQLIDRGLGSGPLVVLGARAGAAVEGDPWDELHHVLADHGIGNLLWRRGRTLDLLVHDDDVMVVAELLGRGVAIGVSDPFTGIESFTGAVREARWALDWARDGESTILRYGEGASSFGPRSIAETEAMVSRVLGPLLEYDAEHQSELTTSLRVFLAANRSWKRAAAELFIHKQTLVYRMRRVEKLTGHRLSETADVAELWFALEALRRVSD